MKVELKRINNYQNNNVVGEAKIYLGKNLLHTEKIYVEVTKEKKLSFFEKIVRWFKSW